MKRPFIALLSAVIALTGIGGSAALARDAGYGRDDACRHEQHDRRHDGRHDGYGRGDVHRPRGPEAHRWERGHRLPPSYRSARHIVVQPGRYHLRPAPRGHQWIRAGNDVLLVATRTGLIVDMRLGFFR